MGLFTKGNVVLVNFPYSDLSRAKYRPALVVADPEINRAFEEDLRKCRFEVFPYTLIYRIVEPDTLADDHFE